MSAQENKAQQALIDKEIEGLTENQRTCYNGLKKLAEEGKGIGMAGPDFVKVNVERIESGKISESEWFAMEYQLLGIIQAMKGR